MIPTHAKIARSCVRWVIGIIICSNGLSYSINRFMLVPVQDQLIEWYDISAVEYNLLMTLYSWPNVILSICCGILIDKIGSRSVLLASWMLCLIGLSIIAYSSSVRDYLLLCIGRTIVGIGNEGLNLSVSIFVLQFFQTNEYGIVFGIYLAFVSLGGAISLFLSYRVYVWSGTLLYPLLLPLFMAAIVCIPLFIFMTMENTGLLSNAETKTDETRLMIEQTDVQPERTKFRLSDIKRFGVCLWVLLIGYVLWTGAYSSSSNISISFLHHMFGYSYEFATWIGLFGQPVSMITYLLCGAGIAKIGRKLDFLIAGNICGMLAVYIYGWLNTHVFWAFFGQFLIATNQGLTYPVVFASIPVLVDEKARGTAFGFASSIRFGTIAICYVVVGLLTSTDDGGQKYIEVQIFVLALMGVSTVSYVLLYYLDVKCNNGTLKKVHAKKEQAMSGDRKESDLSMAKMSFASN